MDMIDFDKFRDWAEERFGNIVVKGKEIKINSVFAEDHKFHMWCRPDGGKKQRGHGVYHCWKTGEKGTLISLVMRVDKCGYGEACDKLDASKIDMAKVEEALAIFEDKDDDSDYTELKKSQITLPDHTFLITDLPQSDYYRTLAEMHLNERKIPIEGLYVCKEGTHRNRIIIPYYGPNGNLIYYNGRILIDNESFSKYLGPDKEIVGKGDVIYIPDGQWPTKGTVVYFTEGEFDAKAIKLSGLASGAFGGKSITDTQAQLIHHFKIVICLDSDSAGLSALPDMGDKLLSHQIEEVSYVCPPKGIKDWNKLFETFGPKVTNGYLQQKKKPYHYWTGDQIRYAQ